MNESSLSPVVQKLHAYVQQGPTEFEITILPTVTTQEMETNELSLQESLVLVEGQFLGMDARSLPWMTHTIRKDYKALKKTMLTTTTDHEETASTTTSTTNMNALHIQILMATDALMLVNPDHSTAWGDRKRALIATNGDWNREMKFLNLLMTQHSKAPSSWGHRKYVLQQIVKEMIQSDDCESKLLDFVNKEIALCSKVAEKFPKNYYAWTHRRYLWSSCILLHLQKDKIQILLQQEFDALQAWLEQHISDHSAVHYLSQVLELQLQQFSNDESLKVAQTSLDLARSLLETHPNHESLWILRRLTVQLLFQHAAKQTISVKDAIHSLMESHVEQVWNSLHFDYGYSSSSSENGATFVYAWSFLVWCMSQLGLGGPERRTKLQDGLSFLQSDGHVYHQMWKIQGEEILLLGK